MTRLYFIARLVIRCCKTIILHKTILLQILHVAVGHTADVLRSLMLGYLDAGGDDQDDLVLIWQLKDIKDWMGTDCDRF